MSIDEAIQIAKGCAELLEFDPMTGESTPEHRIEYQQAQAIRKVIAELEKLRIAQKWTSVKEAIPEVR